MRRDEDRTSSFDLFLDTICNTFGGIVFLAILLAIMIQSRAVVRTEEQIDQQPSPEQVRMLITKLEKLAGERETLEHSLENLPATRADDEDEEYFELAEQVAQTEQRLKESLSIQTKASQKLAEKLELNAIQAAENDAVPAQLKEAERELAQVKAGFQRLASSKQQTLRLPTVKNKTTSSALLLVKNHSLFLARTPSLFGQGFNETQVTTSTLFAGQIRIEPRDGAGWLLGSTKARAEFANVVQQARQNGYTLTIAVWPESYGDFATLREAMIAAGVNYQLWPQAEGEALIISFGAGASSVQ
jgi:hypothetical protein